MGTVLTVWVLISVPHAGNIETQQQQYLGVYATKVACEHMLAALGDPKYALPNAKPNYMVCIAEQPQS